MSLSSNTLIVRRAFALSPLVHIGFSCSSPFADSCGVTANQSTLCCRLKFSMPHSTIEPWQEYFQDSWSVTLRHNSCWWTNMLEISPADNMRSANHNDHWWQNETLEGPRWRSLCLFISSTLTPQRSSVSHDISLPCSQSQTMRAAQALKANRNTAALVCLKLFLWHSLALDRLHHPMLVIRHSIDWQTTGRQG